MGGNAAITAYFQLVAPECFTEIGHSTRQVFASFSSKAAATAIPKQWIGGGGTSII